MADIAHVVVLMLENRSFDSMLGTLYPAGPGFDGLTGTETNPSPVGPIQVWNCGTLTDAAACIPTPDPGEVFSDMNQQVFNTPGKSPTTPPGPANMQGFANNYASQTDTPPYDPHAVMHHFTADQVPVLSTLAQSFGVSDCWHASAPNQTWPNRFFAHTGTARGYVNNSPPHFPYLMPTIYDRLNEAGRTWRVYFHDLPQVATLARMWPAADHLRGFEESFLADAAQGHLPNYSFIEPRYFSDPLTGHMPNDQHPPHNVAYGERLIARIYDALRRSPCWPRTLFIITYDEHGGLYDHVSPPAAVPPDGHNEEGFAFDRYGVRVPAVIVSPWIAAGSVIRPPAGHAHPFDHTSILATLRNLFALRAPLTARDAAAPDLLHALALPAPTNDGPPALPMPSITPSATELDAAHAAAPNHLQTALAELASHLPIGIADIPQHTVALGGPARDTPAFATVAQALAHARAGWQAFLNLPASPPATSDGPGSAGD